MALKSMGGQESNMPSCSALGAATQLGSGMPCLGPTDPGPQVKCHAHLCSALFKHAKAFVKQCLSCVSQRSPRLENAPLRARPFPRAHPGSDTPATSSSRAGACVHLLCHERARPSRAAPSQRKVNVAIRFVFLGAHFSRPPRHLQGERVCPT